jgi:MFS family permease
MSQSEKEAVKKSSIKRSLNLSITEGSFWSVMYGFAESYLQAFAIFLKATNFQLGLISSLPLFLGTISQLFSTRFVKHFGSKKAFIWRAAFLQSFMWLPLLYCAYLKVNDPVWFVIFFFSLYYIFGSVAGPAWGSWMAELVDMKTRGSYFGKRNLICGMVSFSSFLLAGLGLYFSQLQYGSPLVGFVVLFILAFLARFTSSMLLSKQYEPNPGITEEKVPFRTFLKQLATDNYGYLTMFLVLMNFSVFVAGPYFAAYMLKELKMNYFEFMLVNAVAMIVKNIAMPLWGKLGDDYGSLKIMSLSGYFIPLVPIFWLFSENIVYLMCVQAFSGFVWAGFELGSFNFLLDTAHPKRRIQYISYYNVLNGFFILVGSMFGAFLFMLPSIFISSYFLVFFTSGILRYMTMLWFLPKLREVRPVAKVKYHEMIYRMVSLIPATDMLHSLFVPSKPKK